MELLKRFVYFVQINRYTNFNRRLLKMAKGTEAKNFVIEKIKESFGNNYIGEVDKKIYVWSQEGGQPLQIAISLTCPKNPVETVQMGDYDFNNPDTVIAQTAFEPAEITEEEKETVEAMMKKLGL